MRPTKDTLSLECILTDSERLAYSKSLAENISEKTKSENRLKSFSAQAKAEIAGHDADISLLCEKINTGREYRDVLCNIVYDWEKKTKQWIRTDMPDVVARETKISADELQEHLDLQELNDEQPPELKVFESEDKE
jgi:hypothetical protein